MGSISIKKAIKTKIFYAFYAKNIGYALLRLPYRRRQWPINLALSAGEHEMARRCRIGAASATRREKGRGRKREAILVLAWKISDTCSISPPAFRTVFTIL